MRIPSYSYRCQCGHEMEIILRMRDHVNHWPCSKCGEEAPQVINQAPMTIIPEHMRFDWNGYQSPVTGQHIRNKRERVEDLARTGCIEYDPEMKTDYKRRIAEHDQQLDKMVDETVDREIEAMPTRKREKLDAELSAGLTAEPIRL